MSHNFERARDHPEQARASTSSAAVVNRRAALLGLGALSLAGVAAACRSGSRGAAAPTASPAPATNASTSAASTTAASTVAPTSTAGARPTAVPSCALTPELTEGPYYLDLDLLRSDITEGRPGVPLRMLLTVVALPACTPISNAAVDIWHADAAGNYSHFGGPGRSADGETYLRGTQMTDQAGVAEFLTLYPGWYPSRTVHIHMKANFSGARVVTSQIFFPEEVTDAVYARIPYSGRPTRDTGNAKDNIFRGGGPMLDLLPDGDGYIGTMTIGIA